MNKKLALIIGILAFANVIYSFYGYADTDSAQILGFEMNIWVYRLIWSVFALGTFAEYFRKNKE